MRTIDVLDTTLRDGVQAEGISFSVRDKINIVKELDSVGIGFIEIGSPLFNPKEMEFYEQVNGLQLENAKLVTFCSTHKKDVPAEQDEGLQAALSCGVDFVTVFGKSSMLHVCNVLKAAPQENLDMIRTSCAFLTKHKKHVFYDAEHFFDGYKTNADYAMQTLQAAVDGGAEALVLCDTNGGCFPEEIAEIVDAVCQKYGNVKIGIHCHNDTECAVANTITAVMHGASQVQGTYLGMGERCGNANIISVIAGLQLKKDCLCIPEDKLSLLKISANHIAELANTSVKRYTPYVGSSAFSHKAGTHADAVLKCKESFEHISPELVGNERRLPMSELTGSAAVFRKIRKIAPELDRSSPETQEILNVLKHLEHIGYQFEGADASFKILVIKTLGRFKSSFELVSYKVLDELPYGSEHSATATIKVRVDGKLQISAAEGNGPVNALDRALREALQVFYPQLNNMRLVDYKVRVIDTGKASAAMVRVLITSSDGKNTWSTVGVSKDVIEASWLALVDSIEYRLHK